MRRSPARILVAIALIAILPWCLCRLGIATCGVPSGQPADTVPALAGCCGGCCDTATADDGDDSDAPERNGEGCASPCCAPKVAPAAELPPIPVDCVGMVPCWSSAWTLDGECDRATPFVGGVAPPLLDTGPPGVPGSGRAILVAIDRLLI